MLYVNNRGGAVSDLSMQDALDPAFLYVTGSLLYDNSVAACALAVCTALEEAAIFTAVDSGTGGTDTIDLVDVVSFNANIVDAGNQTQANAQLDILADRVWAVLITVQMQ